LTSPQVDKLTTMTNEHKRKLYARELYDTYVSPKATKPLNLSIQWEELSVCLYSL
jgi:hypothetical protein